MVSIFIPFDTFVLDALYVILLLNKYLWTGIISIKILSFKRVIFKTCSLTAILTLENKTEANLTSHHDFPTRQPKRKLLCIRPR